MNYYQFGTGPVPVFCFHGYGEDGSSFQFLEKLVGDQFSFYAPDLPFHGKTEWNEGLNFSEHDLQAVLQQIRNKQGISERKFYIMGFSLGGRIALCLYRLLPAEINKVLLLAPDGLKLNFWYWLATQTWWGNKLFRFTMKHPAWFFGFLKMLNRLGWVNSSIFKFVNYYIGDESIRWSLYQRWTGLRKLKPRLHVIKELVKKHATPTRLIYGKHDRIILPARGERFRKGIEPYCKLELISSGHQVLHEKHAAEILPALLQ